MRKSKTAVSGSKAQTTNPTGVDTLEIALKHYLANGRIGEVVQRNGSLYYQPSPEAENLLKAMAKMDGQPYGSTVNKVVNECVRRHLNSPEMVKKLEAMRVAKAKEAMHASVGGAVYYEDDTWKETLGFKKGKLFWTDGTTMKPMTLKQGAMWWAKRETEWATRPPGNEFDSGGNPQLQAKLLGMIAKAL